MKKEEDLAKKKARKFQLDPKKYSEIVKQIELTEVYLDSCNVTQKRGNLLHQKNLEITIRDKASYYQLAKQKTKVLHKFYLTAKPPELEKDFAVKITATFCLVYDSAEAFSKDFFDIYKEFSLPMHSWPYFRELVQNMTQRLGIPPLTLPLFKKV